MPTARQYPAGAAINGLFYVAGGKGSACGTECDTLEVYDPVSAIWSPLASMPAPRTNVTAAVFGGQIFVFGGDYAGNGTTTVFVYDPLENIWATRPTPIPAPINGAAAAVVGGTIYLIGGTTTDVLHVYNPTTDTWGTGARMPVRISSTSVGVFGGRLYVAGGYDFDLISPGVGGTSASTYEYDPATDGWTLRAAAPIARYSAAFGVLDNQLYVAGGACSA
jgi:N-acetylneuraminic acid mutarotase